MLASIPNISNEVCLHADDLDLKWNHIASNIDICNLKAKFCKRIIIILTLSNISLMCLNDYNVLCSGSELRTASLYTDASSGDSD